MPRVPLISDTLNLASPIAPAVGAMILGRALAHMTLDDPIDADFWPRNFAADLGFSPLHVRVAQASYDELMGA